MPRRPEVYLCSSQPIFGQRDLLGSPRMATYWLFKGNEMKLNAKRPNGVRSDIGAFEFDFSTSIDGSGKNFYHQSVLVQNPVEDILQIRLNMDVADCVNLEIFNVQGMLVQHPVISDVLAGNNIIETKLSNLSSGIYFYVVRSDKYISTGKFLFHKY